MLPGVWDLRGHKTAYLGGVELAGKRVLELGPATGYLTFYMERMGAEVVAFEAGFDVSVDVLPFRGREFPDERAKVMQETIDRNHDAWWHLHRAMGSSATFVQGNIYDMPPDLGTFDITVVGAILLHLRGRGSALTGGTSDHPDHGGHRALAGRRPPTRVQHHALLPLGRAPPDELVVDLPGAVVSMLARGLGFGDTTTTTHSQRHHLAHDIAADAMTEVYTVVGRHLA